jgi:hypothetical protein
MEYINGGGYEIKEKVFQRNGTYIAYPILISETEDEKLDSWNSIIVEDIGRILNIYSAYTFAPPPAGEDLYLQDTLHITYEIKRNDNRYLSIVYKADFYSPYAAYPTQMVYTTNIDKEKGRRLRLSDIIPDPKFLADDLTSWDIVSKYDDLKEYPGAVRDYINGLGKEILQMGLEKADIIGADNYLGIYSYLTPDRVGISISVPHYLGDHAEYENAINPR